MKTLTHYFENELKDLKNSCESKINELSQPAYGEDTWYAFFEVEEEANVINHLFDISEMYKFYDNCEIIDKHCQMPYGKDRCQSAASEIMMVLAKVLKAIEHAEKNMI